MFEKDKEIEKITKMSLQMQAQNLKIFARIDTEYKMEILNQQKVIFHKLKEIHKNTINSILTLCSLLLAIKLVVTDETEKIICIKKNKRKSSKREKLLDVWAIIRNLKYKNKLSFREIKKYLKKYHKIEVAHSTLCEMWNQIEREGQQYEFINQN